MPEDSVYAPVKSDKLYSIDYARGVAVLLVASGHFFDLHPFSYETVNLIRRSVSFSGLPLFFVLSGFLLTRQMTYYSARYKDVSRTKVWSRFFLNRVLRIYPAYLVSLLVFVVAGSYPFADFIVHALNIHNVFPGYFVSINPVYWTLAVEFQWYLVFPFLFFLFSRINSIRARVFLLFSLLVPGFLMRQFLIHQFQHGIIDRDQLIILGQGPLISHLFAFCLGIVLFYYIRERNSEFSRPDFQILAAGIVFCLAGGLMTVWGIDNYSVMYGIHLNLGTIFFLPGGSVLLLYWIVGNEEKFGRKGNKANRIIQWVGIISYSIYLWHYPLFLRFQKGTGSLFLDSFISCGVVLVVSCLSYFFVERYFMKFKTIFWGRLS